DLYFRCPYQAKVMKMLEASSRKTGAKRSTRAGMEGVRWRRGASLGPAGVTWNYAGLHAVSTTGPAVFTNLKTVPHTRTRWSTQARINGNGWPRPDRRGQPQHLGNGGRIPRGPRLRGRLRLRRPRRLPAGGREHLRRDRPRPDAAAAGRDRGLQA